MLGKPKYKFNDILGFELTTENEKIQKIGRVYIVDAFGTFEQNEEPSYDIMVTEDNCLYKHIRESMVQEVTDIDQFKFLCSLIKREGISEFLTWLDTTDFYTAPASTKYHGAYTGGLLHHSLQVYYQLERLVKAYPEIKIDMESRIITALFHDVCKTYTYVPDKKKSSFSKNEQYLFGGHGSKSVYLIQQYMKLSPEEASAINCHMGAYSENSENVSQVYEVNPLAWMLHVADEADAYLKNI